MIVSGNSYEYFWDIFNLFLCVVGQIITCWPDHKIDVIYKVEQPVKSNLCESNHYIHCEWVTVKPDLPLNFYKSIRMILPSFLLFFTKKSYVKGLFNISNPFRNKPWGLISVSYSIFVITWNLVTHILMKRFQRWIVFFFRASLRPGEGCLHILR